MRGGLSTSSSVPSAGMTSRLAPRSDEEAAAARTREDGIRMRHHDERAEPAVLDDVQAAGEAVDLRVIPGNGEHQRRVEQDAKVVRIRRALDEVAKVEHSPFAERL